MMSLFSGQPRRHKHREQTYEHRVEGRKETVRHMERVTWKLTLSCIKYIANGNLLSVSENSNRGSVSK